MQPALLQPLQHRRDVAGLCVMYKILKQGVPHLATLRQPWATPHSYSTRDAHKRDQQLIVPFARTETFFRSFLPRYSRLWNRVVRQTDMHQAATLHIFKCAPIWKLKPWLVTQELSLINCVGRVTRGIAEPQHTVWG
ncbi:hypothetical protein GWK47_037740 [Chionoecetes opilio]|uniref:Uncharacterized protein n=1 Tax=Chionoecetes opilio TaxID=41210 RepID=A0A8J4YEM7_CHIOP|nr:hypothetical protein GWK47_037740 [Chionoecetes opilio]